MPGDVVFLVDLLQVPVDGPSGVVGIDTPPVSRFNKQDQRGGMPPFESRLRDTHGFDVYQQWPHPGRMSERHGPADGNRTGSWQCFGHQSLQAELLGRFQGEYLTVELGPGRLRARPV